MFCAEIIEELKLDKNIQYEQYDCYLEMKYFPIFHLWKLNERFLVDWILNFLHQMKKTLVFFKYSGVSCFEAQNKSWVFVKDFVKNSTKFRKGMHNEYKFMLEVLPKRKSLVYVK